jgi:hypothetical protein
MPAQACCAQWLTCRHTQEARAAADAWRSLHADLQRSHAPQRAWQAQMASAAAAAAAAAEAPATAADAPECAWWSLLGRELPMEGLCRQVLTLVGSSAAAVRSRMADCAARGNTPVEAAWMVRAARAARRRHELVRGV